MNVKGLCVFIFVASVSGFIDDNSPETDHAELLHLITQEQSMRMNIESQLHTLQAQLESLQTVVHNLTVSGKSSNAQIAFTVRLSINVPDATIGTILIYDHVITNIGNAYSTTTGIFHCPISGLYLFSGTVLADTHGYIVVNIVKNGIMFARPHSGVNANMHASGSDTALIHLNIGDEVYVTMGGGSSTYYDNMSLFSGVLLKAD